MNTLEEEIIIPLQRQMAEQATVKKRYSPSPKWKKFWKVFFTVGLLSAFGMAITILWKLERRLAVSVRTAITEFRWLVMAEGDAIAIDEVGAYLKKIDGVADVNFISAEETYAKVKADPLLASDLALLAENPFPAAWSISWKPSEFDVAKISSSIDDVRLFPGVVDVASDSRILAKIEHERQVWQRLKRGLAFTLVAALLSCAVLLFVW